MVIMVLMIMDGVVLIETYKLLFLVIKDIITHPLLHQPYQKYLYFLKKNSSKSRELWIEPYDISRYLNFFDNKIIGNHYVYVTNDNDFSKILKTDVTFYLNDNLIINDFSQLYSIIKQHFKNTKLPVVIDDGVFSYCFTLDNNNNDIILLIDPHQPDNPVQIKTLGFLKNRFWMIFFPYSIGI